jgi:putative transposase
MARRKRLFLDGQLLHVIQRGNNRLAVFFARDDYAQYIAWLGEAAREYGLAVYAYVLMTNHVHILAAPEDADSLSRTMQSLGRRYVRHVNNCYGRTGTLWEGRYRATAVDGDAYFFDCCRYIERNPVRARMAARVRDWRWSSYRAHALGAADPLLSEHPLYRALGRTAARRQSQYLLRFRAPDDEEFVSALRQGTNGGWPVGGELFKQEIAKALKCRVTPLPPGPKPQPPPGKRRPKRP